MYRMFRPIPHSDLLLPCKAVRAAPHEKVHNGLLASFATGAHPSFAMTSNL